FARIYPLYICCLFAIVIFNIVLKIPFDLGDLFAHIFTIQSWIPMHAQTLNFPDWSLSIEFFFYAIFPFLINIVYKRFSLNTLIIAIVSFWVFSQLLLTYAVDHWYVPDPSISCDLIHFFPLSHLNEFLLGNVVAMFFLKYKEQLNSKWNDLLVMASFILLILLLKYPVPFLYHNGFLAIAFVPLIVSLSGDKSKIAKIFNWKPLVFLGEISFGIYLLQLPVYLFYQSVFFYLGFTFNFYVFLLLLIAVAALSYFLIEKPSRDFINSWYSKKIAKQKSE
ncbi:MAG: acyltransferase family protein, partial [Flavobacteriales bacterium]